MRIKAKRLGACALAGTMMLTMLSGCGGSSNDGDTSNTGDTSSNTATETASESSATASGDVKEFDMFIAMPGTEINDDNEIQQISMTMMYLLLGMIILMIIQTLRRSTLMKSGISSVWMMDTSIG